MLIKWLNASIQACLISIERRITCADVWKAAPSPKPPASISAQPISDRSIPRPPAKRRKLIIKIPSFSGATRCARSPTD